MEAERGTRRRRLAITLIGSGLLALAWPASAAAQSTLLSFTPEADTYVDSTLPTSSFGTTTSVYADGKPIKQAFMRFRVSGLDDRQVLGVRLRLHQRDHSTDGGRVFAMSDTGWTEAMTFETRPPIDGPQLATFPAVSSGVTYEADLGPIVTGDGPISLALDSTNGDGVRWSTREYASARPQLIVETTEGAPIHGLSEIAAPLVGSSDPTYYTSQHRVALTQGGRQLVVHGKHATGVQLAWRDPDGTWQTGTTGSVGTGVLLSGTGTGDWPAAIAVERDSAGEEHAWVVWSGPAHTHLRPLQLVRLSNLDSLAGPTVGPVVTLVPPGRGNYRPDIAFERAADGTARGVVTWLQPGSDTTFDIAAAWFTDLDTDTPALSDRAILDTGTVYKVASTLVGGSGARAVTRAASGYLVVKGHEPGQPGTSWWTGSRGMKSAGYPSATALDSGAILAAAETDLTNHIVQVQRFTAGGAPASAELHLTGYRDPTITTDGTRAWVIMVRMSDGFVVSREHVPGSGWSGEDRVEIGDEGGGGHRHPNALRRADDALRFIVRGPDGGATGVKSAVLGFQREL